DALPIFLAAPDDERARNLVLARREPLGAGAGVHHAARWYPPLERHRLSTSDVDDRRGGGDHDVGAEHDLALQPYALDHDGARAQEAAVLDDHRRRARRLEHPADPHAARQVHVLADLRAAPHRGPG